METTAFAVHLPDTRELRIYRRPGPLPRPGGRYDGMMVDAVWPGLESDDPTRLKPFLWLSDIQLVTCADEGVSPVSTRSWFAGMTRLESVDIGRMDMSRVRDAGHMFDGCASLRLDCTRCAFPAGASHEGFSTDAPGVLPPAVWKDIERAEPAGTEPDRAGTGVRRHGGRPTPDPTPMLEWVRARRASGLPVSARLAYEAGLGSSLSSAARIYRRVRDGHPELFPADAAK